MEMIDLQRMGDIGMEKFTPSEICADIKIYDYKKKVKYDEKSLMILKETGQVIKAGKECETMADALPAHYVYLSPLVLGRVSDYTCAEKMMKQLLYQSLGKPSFTGYGEGLIFVHEKLNEVEMKAYLDLIYQAGARHVIYMDERTKGIPEGMPWEKVIWGMENTYKSVRFAVEITKEQPMDYLRYSLAELRDNGKRWGLGEECLQEWLQK